MKIILKQDIDSLGTAGQVIEVKRGYARNYLIPHGLAVEATAGNMKSFEQEQKMAHVRSLRGKKEAEELADKIAKLSITIAMQVGEEDRLFGAVTSQTIADLLKENGCEIDRRKIVLDDPIKALGVYEIPIKLHTEVTATAKLWVVRE
ncbi:50S ribosomal protein L9 [candidate division KSB1 bacterium]|nr:50S ribosomal protein L9 [candidate division KSB1 bacterium]